MKCPICKDKVLISKTIEDIDLDICEYCSGYWFDTGEIEYYKANVKGLFNPKVPKIEGFIAASNTNPQFCPKCEQSTLQLGSVGTNSIYKCSQCAGHFYDMQNISNISLDDILLLVLTSIA